MASFDAFPPDLRVFVANYPRGAKATQVAALLREVGGNVARCKREIEAALPIEQHG